MERFRVENVTDVDSLSFSAVLVSHYFIMQIIFVLIEKLTQRPSFSTPGLNPQYRLEIS